jgi:hypothetical protein
MSEVDRVGIVSDAFACGASGYASTVDALELVEAYRGKGLSQSPSSASAIANTRR